MFRFLIAAFVVAVLDDTVKMLPVNVRLTEAVTAFVVPSDIMILLPLALFIVLNPVPDVPELPDEPDVPLEPDVPDEPDVPELPAADDQVDPFERYMLLSTVL